MEAPKRSPKGKRHQCLAMCPCNVLCSSNSKRRCISTFGSRCITTFGAKCKVGRQVTRSAHVCSYFRHSGEGARRSLGAIPHRCSPLPSCLSCGLPKPLALSNYRGLPLCPSSAALARRYPQRLDVTENVKAGNCVAYNPPPPFATPANCRASRAAHVRNISHPRYGPRTESTAGDGSRGGVGKVPGAIHGKTCESARQRKRRLDRRRPLAERLRLSGSLCVKAKMQCCVWGWGCQKWEGLNYGQFSWKHL